MSSRSVLDTAPRGPGIYLGLVAAIVVTFAAAGIGSLFTFPALEGWYADLAKPPFNPPNGVFGPVWSVLYLLMAVAVWRVWLVGRRRNEPVGAAIGLFAVQLVLNVAWSGVFFGMHETGAALAVIAALWLAILATILSFRTIDGAAALMLLPSLAWVTFATALNAAIWQLNG